MMGSMMASMKTKLRQILGPFLALLKWMNGWTTHGAAVWRACPIFVHGIYSKCQELNIRAPMIPMDPSVFSENVWGMMWGSAVPSQELFGSIGTSSFGVNPL